MDKQVARHDKARQGRSDICLYLVVEIRIGRTTFALLILTDLIQMRVQSLCGLGDMGTRMYNVLRVAVSTMMFLRTFDVAFGFID